MTYSQKTVPTFNICVIDELDLGTSEFIIILIENAFNTKKIRTDTGKILTCEAVWYKLRIKELHNIILDQVILDVLVRSCYHNVYVVRYLLV